MRYHSSTVVIGSHGQPVVTRGYVEFSDGTRIYDDQIVVGRYGQYEVSPGCPTSTTSNVSSRNTRFPWK